MLATPEKMTLYVINFLIFISKKLWRCWTYFLFMILPWFTDDIYLGRCRAPRSVRWVGEKNAGPDAVSVL